MREQPIMWNLHLEPKLPPRKKLIICVATGWLNRQQNSTQPYSPQEIAGEIIDAYQAGASIWHIHPRHRDSGSLMLSPEEKIEIHMETCNLVFRECPDIITTPSGAEPISDDSVDARIKAYFEPLVKANPHYAEMGIVNIGLPNMGLPTKRQLTYVNRYPQIIEQVEALQALGIKPEIFCFSMGALEEVKEYLLSKVKKPWYLGISLGSHGMPPGKLELVKVMLDLLPSDGVVWQSVMGGRNWLLTSVQAIIYGCDVVRVGKEDTIFTYPDSDKIITRCSEAVAKIATIARELGIEVASPREARERLGLRPLGYCK